MATVAIFLAPALAILLGLRMAGGMRAYGWGALMLGIACAIYLAVGTPGRLALVILPAAIVLIALGGGTLLSLRRKTSA
jgi:hypothetical protein